MWQRMESFTKCIINCKSSFKSSTLADCLSTLSQKEVETAARHTLSGQQTTNTTPKKLFTSIRGQSSSIVHSNQTASFVRQKLFSLWHYFGAPPVFAQLHLAMSTISVFDYMQHTRNITFQV